MTTRMVEIREAVRQALEHSGAVELTLSTTGTSHQRFDFLVDGRRGRFVFACSPKTPRSVLNAAASAKRTAREYREGRRGHPAPE